MELKLNVYKISEKKPDDGAVCLVLKNRYVGLQVYNEKYKCWDTSDGDDYDFDVEDTDIWMKLPTADQMKY